MRVDWVRMIALIISLIVGGFCAAWLASVAQAAPVARDAQQATYAVRDAYPRAVIHNDTQYRRVGIDLERVPRGARPDVVLGTYCRHNWTFGRIDYRPGADLIEINRCVRELRKKWVMQTYMHEWMHYFGVAHIGCRCIINSASTVVDRARFTPRDVRELRRVV